MLTLISWDKQAYHRFVADYLPGSDEVLLHMAVLVYLPLRAKHHYHISRYLTELSRMDYYAANRRSDFRAFLANMSTP